MHDDANDDIHALPLGRIVDRMRDLREQRKALDRESKKLKDEFDELAGIVIHRCREEEAGGARGATASAVITENTVPKIVDWDTFTTWAIENEALYLLERRVKSAPFKELVNAGDTPEGLEPTTVYGVSLTALK